MYTMKNFIFRLSVMAVAMIFSLSCTSDKLNPEPIWDNAAMVFYANVGEVHAKSGLAEMDITKLEQQLDQEFGENSAEAAVVKAILKNPNASGFALDRPVYVAVGEYGDDVNRYNLIASIEVASATEVDSFFKTMTDDYDEAQITLEKDRRIISIDKDVLFGYDNKRLVLVATEDSNCNLHEVLNKHMKYDAADMSRFNGYDAALYVDINDDTLALLAEEVDVDDIQLSDYFNENATAIMGLSFDDGSISCNTELTGLAEDVVNPLKKANAASLKRLESSPIALLNMGVNGEVLADLANVAIDAAMAELGGANNEFNIYKNIALGVIASINGDMMFALSDAEGRTVEDYMGDQQLVFSTANALFTAEVIDDYIMKNIDTYGGAFLVKQGGKYSVNAFGNRITIAQDDNLFYVGVNNSGEVKKHSAYDDKWAKDVADCYLYAMIDFNELFKSGFGRMAKSLILNDIRNPKEREVTLSTLSAIDSLHFSVDGENDKMYSELMITTNDSSKNSLQQIVELCYELAYN